MLKYKIIWYSIMLAYFVVTLIFSNIISNYANNYPHIKNINSGRVYVLRLNGKVAYLTKEENEQLNKYKLIWLSATLFGVSVGAILIKKGKVW